METKNTSFKHNNGFTRVGKVLPEVSKQYNLDQAVALHQVTKSWQTAIAGFFEEAIELTKVMEFKNGKLTIACLSAGLGYKIQLLSQNIIAAINSILGKKLVYALWIES